MHDSSLVGFGERTGRLSDDVQRAYGRQRADAHHVLRERFTLEELHDVVPEAVLGDPVVEHAYRVWMREFRGRANFTLEACEGAVGTCLFLRLEDLHRHVALQAGVVRDPDLTHASGGETALEAIAPEASSRKHLPTQGPDDMAPHHQKRVRSK